jgi:hypothetical protein
MTRQNTVGSKLRHHHNVIDTRSVFLVDEVRPWAGGQPYAYAYAFTIVCLTPQTDVSAYDSSSGPAAKD